MRVDADARVFLTGASRGIGRALAEALAERGATLGLAARGAEELEALAARLGARAFPCDVADAAQVRAAIDAFAPNLVIANAGIAHYGRFRDQDAELHERMTQVNWLGTLNTVRAALPYAEHIVIVSSGAGLRAFPEAAVYGATKAAQRAFAEALRHELPGVGVTTVFPGEIRTELHAHEKTTMPAWYRGDEKLADPADLARAVIEAVEKGRRTVAYPREVALLGLNGVAPRLVDALLRRLRGTSSAPRRD
jgi:short-subunit dehydrogenase